MDKLILVLVILFYTNLANAQLFETKDFYPQIKTVKGKYYNGSGGGGYWSLEKLDNSGRPIEKESYHKNELLSRENYTYNDSNDKLYKILTFSIDNPNRIDTIVRYEYQYSANRIIYQKSCTGKTKQDSTVIRLIENQADTTLIYQSKSYCFRPKTGTTDIYETRYTFEYDNGLLVRFEKFEFNDSSSEITYYEYYPNRKLKRRKIERVPEPEFKNIYVGGPGSDDMSYEYKFDKSGRVKTLYYLIENIRYKIATYIYR